MRSRLMRRQCSRVFLCFHFTRLFPAIAGKFPAHSPRLASVKPGQGAPADACFNQGKVS